MCVRRDHASVVRRKERSHEDEPALCETRARLRPKVVPTSCESLGLIEQMLALDRQASTQVPVDRHVRTPAAGMALVGFTGLVAFGL